MGLNRKLPKEEKIVYDKDSIGKKRKRGIFLFDEKNPPSPQLVIVNIILY